MPPDTFKVGACSYAYDCTKDDGCPSSTGVVADRAATAALYPSFSCAKIKLPPWWVNSSNHQFEGQNVLFVDSHVTFHRTPNVGIAQDHIYKSWGASTPSSEQLRQGAGMGNWVGGIRSEKDACLVGEANRYPYSGHRP